MGRSIESVRQAVNATTGRWERASRELAGRRPACEKTAACAKQHSSEAFYVCEGPLEAVLFSAFVEILKERASRGPGGRAPDVDP